MKKYLAMLLLLLAPGAFAQVAVVGQAAFERVDSANVTFADAQAEAATRTYLGLNGELASVLSAAEQTAVESLLAGAPSTYCWMGGSDSAVEGEWRWLDGTQFWQGDAAGSAVAGQYTNWDVNEPNNFLTGDEDALTIVQANGGWNDYPETSPLGCYIVRYNLALLPVPATQPLGLWLLMLAMAALGGYYLTRKAAI